MSTRRLAGFPGRLEIARRRFDQWRRCRQKGERIPESLWAAAVEVAAEYGVSRTASTLRVAYYALKKRLAKQALPSRPMPQLGELPAFVEFTAPTQAPRGECLLELEDARGARMRVHLKGVEAPDLAALSRSFWGSQS